jgi:hypothetical protein
VYQSSVLRWPQADLELLHSQEYLQAIAEFAAHLQALTEKEHQLRGKSMVPTALRDFQCDTMADVSTTDQTSSAAALHCITCRAFLNAGVFGKSSYWMGRLLIRQSYCRF